MKNILLFILFICSSNIIKAQDTLSMRSGENILVKVIEVSNVRLKLKNTFKGYIEVGTAEVKYKKLDNLNGPVFSMLKSDLLMIKYQNGTSDDFSKEAQKIKNQKIWIRLGGPLLAAGLLIGLGKFLSAVASAGSW
jgi:hypothetical protein